MRAKPCSVVWYLCSMTIESVRSASVTKSRDRAIGFLILLFPLPAFNVCAGVSSLSPVTVYDSLFLVAYEFGRLHMVGSATHKTLQRYYEEEMDHQTSNTTQF